MLSPVLAEISTAPLASRPITSSICCFTRSRFGGGQVDLVEDGDDLVIVVERLVDVGERLRLHALAGIHHQQGAFARGEAAAHLIGEVHMAGRVHQVQLIQLAVLGAIIQADGLRLDGDPALLLDLHIIENLRLAGHFALGHAAARLDKPVGERRFAVVDMGDDGKIADARKRRHAFRRGFAHCYVWC